MIDDVVGLEVDPDLLGTDAFEDTTEVDPWENFEYIYVQQADDLEGGRQSSAWNNVTAQTLTEEELRERYDNSITNYDDTFGSWEEYRDYMRDYTMLVQDNPELQWWTADAGIEEADYAREALGMNEVEFYRHLQNMGDGQTRGSYENSDEYAQFQLDYDNYRNTVRRTAFQDSFLNSDFLNLFGEYGISPVTQNNDGDTWAFTGSGYNELYEVDDHMDPSGWASTLAVVGLGAAFLGPLATQLAPTLGATGATAAASGIISSAQQLVLTGDVDPLQAFASAALSAGMTELGFMDVVEASNVSSSVEDLVVAGVNIPAGVGEAASFGLSDAATFALSAANNLGPTTDGSGAPINGSVQPSTDPRFRQLVEIASELLGTDATAMSAYENMFGELPWLSGGMGDDFFSAIASNGSPEDFMSNIDVLVRSLPAGVPIPASMVTLGTLSDLVNNPSGALSDLWDRTGGAIVDVFKDPSGGLRDPSEILDGLGDLLSGAVSENPSILSDLPTVLQGAIAAGVWGPEVVSTINGFLEENNISNPFFVTDDEEPDGTPLEADPIPDNDGTVSLDSLGDDVDGQILGPDAPDNPDKVNIPTGGDESPVVVEQPDRGEGTPTAGPLEILAERGEEPAGGGDAPNVLYGESTDPVTSSVNLLSSGGSGGGGMLSGASSATPFTANVNYGGMIMPRSPVAPRTNYLDELESIIQRARQK